MAYVASMYPSCGQKKTCTPLLACSSVRLRGPLGMPPGVPHASAVNVFVCLFSCTCDVTSFPETGRSGVLAYAYSGSVSCSMALQPGPESMSKIVIAMSADCGNTTAVSIPAQPYLALAVSRAEPEHDCSLNTVVPQQSQPDA